MNINEDLIKNVINVDTSINDKSRVNFIKGKNLMQIKTIGNTTTNGITYSISNDGTITLNGTATARMQFGYLLKPLKSFANEYYCLSYIYISGTLTDGHVSVNNQDGNHDWKGYNIELFKNSYSSMCDLKPMSMDLNMNGAAIIRVENGSVLNNLKFKLMFIKSKVRDYNYEPYITPSIVVDGGTIYTKGQNEVYSTAERRIGTWIDGKPLYRKVYTGTKVSGNNSTIELWNLNIDYVNFYGFLIGNQGTTEGTYEFPINYYENSNAFIRTNIHRKYMNLTIVSANSPYFNGNYTIVVEYTKTTD